jgi:hypothetical protein
MVGAAAGEEGEVMGDRLGKLVRTRASDRKSVLRDMNVSYRQAFVVTPGIPEIQFYFGQNCCPISFWAIDKNNAVC